MPDVKDDVKDMLEDFLDKPPEETPPVETPPVETPPTETLPVEAPPEEKPPEEKPPEEKPPEEKPPVEAPPEEKPPKEVPPVEAPPEEKPPEAPPVPPTEMELLQRQNQLLLERIEKISGGESVQPVAAPEVKPDEKPDVPVVAPVAAPPAEVKIEEINFLEGKTQEEVERIVENPAEFNKMLNQVYAKAIERSIPLAQERSLLSIPQVVVSHLQRYNTMKGLVDDFYKENPDLKVVQRSVGMIANEVHSEHTDWSTKQVFDESAVRTRKALGLPEASAKPVGGKPPVTPVNAPPPDPAFANPSGSRRRGPAGAKLSGIAKEIDELVTFD